MTARLKARREIERREIDPKAGIRVAELWRYPVKSLLGEQLVAVELDERGVVGDRLYAIEDSNGKFGSGKTTRRFRLMKGLFELSARTSNGEIVVSMPDGRELLVGSSALDETLSERYGEELHVTREVAISHFDTGPVHIVSTAALQWLSERLGKEVSARRFRPNLLLATSGEALVEHTWCGAELRVGSCVLQVGGTAERCVMVTNAQSELLQDPAILRKLVHDADMQFGIYASVVVPGTISQGDIVSIRPASPGLASHATFGAVGNI